MSTQIDPIRDQLNDISRRIKALGPRLSEATQIDARLAILCLHSALNEATDTTQPRCHPHAAQILHDLCGDPLQ